jgi:N-acyl-D-aspartate/D-glutamate deacylase
MGNCGFSIAPANEDERELVIRNLERAEDISAVALEQGIDWTWETFPQYLDAVERMPKGINYAAYVGHSALRTWAMGERAFECQANDDDLQRMEDQLKLSMVAGAKGFSTSRGDHETSDGRPVASRLASWDEIAHLVTTVGRSGKGVFEIALGGASDLNEEQTRLFASLRSLGVATGVPITFGVLGGAEPGDDMCWQKMNLIESTNAGGGRMFGQSHCREFGVLLSFRTNLPFDLLDDWREFRSLSLEQQEVGLRNPTVRNRLVEAAIHGNYGSHSIGADPSRPDYSWIRVLDSVEGPNPTVAEIAKRHNCHPVEAFIDAALEHHLDRFFLQVLFNRNEDDVLRLLRHPRNVMTFSDSGAHVGQIMDSSIQTGLLSYWVRKREMFTFEEAIRMLSLAPAMAWGFHDRGLLREGMVADINVIDPERISSRLPVVEYDLPGGEMRLTQRADGILATLVGGQVVLSGGVHSGLLPGMLLRA